MKVKDHKPSANERSHLITRLIALGLRAQDLASIVSANRTRGEIADELRLLVRSLKKRGGSKA